MIVITLLLDDNTLDRPIIQKHETFSKNLVQQTLLNLSQFSDKTQMNTELPTGIVTISLLLYCYYVHRDVLICDGVYHNIYESHCLKFVECMVGCIIPVRELHNPPVWNDTNVHAFQLYKVKAHSCNVSSFACMNVCMYVCMCIYVYVCMYVCMCMYVCIRVCLYCTFVFMHLSQARSDLW